MSTSQIELLGERRTSRRRRVRTEKVLDQYMILNPFKKSNRSSVIPDQLNKQLRKLEYLSNANLQKIKLRKTAQEQNENLSRMRKASFEQEEKYLSCLKEWPALQTSSSMNFTTSTSLKPTQRRPAKSFITSITHLDIQNLVQYEDSKMDEECGSNLDQMNPQSNLFSDNYDNKNFFPQLKHDVHLDNLYNNYNQNNETHLVERQEEQNQNFEIGILQDDLFNLRTTNNNNNKNNSEQQDHEYSYSYYYH